MPIRPQIRHSLAAAAAVCLTLALALPQVAGAGTLHQPTAPGNVFNQSAVVDPATGDLLLVWSIENGGGPDPIRFCRVPVGSSTCPSSVLVGTPTTDSLPRIASAGTNSYRVVAVSSADIRSWRSTDGGATWGAAAVASTSPGLGSVNAASRAIQSGDGSIYVRTDSSVFRLNTVLGTSYESVQLPFVAGTEASNSPGIVQTSNGLVTTATRYALTGEGVKRHTLATAATFTTPGSWTQSFTPRSGMLSGGASLAGPANAGPPAVLATPTSDGGVPTILTTPFSTITAGADATLPGGPFTGNEPATWVRAASGSDGIKRTVAWVGRNAGAERIRYATSTSGAAFTPASALYSTAVPDLSSSSVEAVTDDSGRGYLTWVQGTVSRFVDLTAVADPVPGGSGGGGGTGGGGGGGGTGGGGTGDGKTPGSKAPADPAISVVVPGGRLRLTILGTRVSKNRRCVVSKRRVKLKVTLSKRAKPRIRRVGFQLDGKTRATDRRAPFASRFKVVRAKGKRSAGFRAVTVLRQGSKTSRKRLTKKVRFCG